jgi:hypothetical protein
VVGLHTGQVNRSKFRFFACGLDGSDIGAFSEAAVHLFADTGGKLTSVPKQPNATTVVGYSFPYF